MSGIDFLSGEEHFSDHLAPIWHALPVELRGRFITDPVLVPRGRELGIEMTSHVRGPGGPVFVASWGDVQTARRARRTRIARIEHGIGQSYAGDPRSQAAVHESYAGGRGQEAVSLFLAPNRHSADRWRRAYPNASVVTVGSPKIDNPPAYEPSDEPVIAVSTHFDARVCPETRSAWPLYRDAMAALAKSSHVIAHAHPRAQVEVSHWARRHAIEWVPSLREVQRRAAVYVCDNSSSLYEFAATGRPVVVLDIPTNRTGPGYRRDVHHGLRFWEAADVGVRIDDPADLAAAVRTALADAPERRRAREEALDVVYAYRDGNAAQRAAAALVEWATQDARAAA